MTNVADIISQIGHSNFASAIGVKPSAVSNMKSSNVIPAKKYLRVCAVCAEYGLPRPSPGLFTFDPAAERRETFEAAPRSGADELRSRAS